MKKKKGNIVKIIIALVILAIFGTVVFMNVFAKKPPTIVSYNKLEKMDLVDSINIKGIVKSVDSKQVYGNQPYTIKKVNFEVGDKVSAGDKLVELDTDELALNISQRKSQLSKQEQANLTQLQSSERLYNEALRNYSGGTDASIVSAQSRVETSKKSLEDAQKNYDDKVKDSKSGDVSPIINAENAIRDAKINLDNQQENFGKIEILYKNGVVSQNDFETAEKALSDAKNRYNDALKSLDTTSTSIDKEVDQLKLVLDTAKINYNEAVTALESARLSSKQTVDRQKDAVASSQVAINYDADLISIQILEKQYDKAEITSPITGTVTAVYAKEGVAASGLLFVIEDTENLKILTKVKEFDYGRISLGLPVKIKSDATGDKEFDGKISLIAPTSIKTQAGEVDTSKDIEFETEVSVETKGSDLKIGMNARLDVIITKIDGAFGVPFDSILSTKDESGNTINEIFYVDTDESGKSIARKMLVEVGLETDFYVEIKGEGLKEGLKIISDLENITDGMEITTQDEIGITTPEVKKDE